MIKIIVSFALGFMIATVGLSGMFTAINSAVDITSTTIKDNSSKIDEAINKGKDVVRDLSNK